MQLETIGDTRSRLVEWGRWVRAGGAGLGYGRGLILPLGATVRSPMITDDEAVLIDAAVARLRRRDYEMGACIVMYYPGQKTDQRIGEMLRLSRSKVQQLRYAAESWIDGALQAAAKNT
jgi:hypothetical protein